MSIKEQFVSWVILFFVVVFCPLFSTASMVINDKTDSKVSAPIKNSLLFNKLENHMISHYMQGLKRDASGVLTVIPVDEEVTYLSHEWYLNDRNRNPLFKDFKDALRSSNPVVVTEARKLFDNILTRLKECLSRELSYQMCLRTVINDKAVMMFRIIGSMSAVLCLFALLVPPDVSGLTPPGSVVGCVPLSVWCIYGKKMRWDPAKKVENNISILEKRIESWSQLLP